MTYDPRKLGADCGNCPFYKPLAFRPVPPARPKHHPRLRIVAESPGTREAVHRIPFTGPTGQRVRKFFQEEGWSLQHDAVLVYRIACSPPYNLKTKSSMATAVACCTKRFQADLASSDGLPTIFMGSHAYDSLLSAREAKLRMYCPTDNTIVTHHPTHAYFRKAPLSHYFESSLRRFLAGLLGRKAVRWPTILLEPSDQVLEILRNWPADSFGWDIETNDINPDTASITCWGVACKDVAISLPWDDYTSAKQGKVDGLLSYGILGRAIREAFIKLLESDRRQSTQNGNYDLRGARSRGINARNDVDVMHLHGILYPALQHNLEDISMHLFGPPERWKSIFHGNDEDAKISEDFVDSLPLFLRDYNAKDAWTTEVSAKIMLRQLNDGSYPAGPQLFADAMRHNAIALKSWGWGWDIDPKRQARLGLTVQRRMEQFEQRIQTMMGGRNPGSNDQLREFFYQELDEEVTHFTESELPSVDKESLAAIAVGGKTAEGRKAAKMILEWRMWSKAYNTYIVRFAGQSMVRPDAHVTAQVSGRWSYRKPAMQTIPSRPGLPKIKTMFVGKKINE